jgi:glycosyltransferase involved in cell wall biosynthesis
VQRHHHRHVHAPSRYLTPSVITVLEQEHVPVVMTLHDWKPWCTNRLLFARGEVCERCKGGRHWHAAAIGCVQRSHAKSLVGAFEAYDHDRRGVYAAVRRWIAPSRFVRDKAHELGGIGEKTRVLVHGVEPARPAPAPTGLPEKFVLYAGRLSEEKGVSALPGVAERIDPVPLLVAGSGPFVERRHMANLRYLGHLDESALAAVRARASVVLVPSRFPETFGYAVAEALLDGRVVIASRIGALPELIEHGVDGLLVPPDDPGALIAATGRALEFPEATAWGERARARAAAAFAPQAHADGLVAIYREAIHA